MFNKKPAKMKACINCGMTKAASAFNETKSPMFVDGRLGICKECLNAEIFAQNGVWDAVDLICQWADAPFIPENFTRIYQTNPEQAMGLYLDHFNDDEYSRLNWGMYHEKWSEAIKENKETSIHPVFNQKEIDELVNRFGAENDVEVLYKLNRTYESLKKTYGFSDAAVENKAIQAAKIDHQIDLAISRGDDKIDKLVRAADLIQKGAGFTPDNAHDMDSFESVSEIAKFYESIGWAKKFHNDEPKDIVDLTIADIQSYNRQLYEGEPSIPDNLEVAFAKSRRLQEIDQNKLMEINKFGEEDMVDLAHKDPIYVDGVVEDEYEEFVIEEDFNG